MRDASLQRIRVPRSQHGKAQTRIAEAIRLMPPNKSGGAKGSEFPLRQWSAEPKAELHVHLEGSVEPDTLRQMHPQVPAAEIQAKTTFMDFAGFIQAYVWVNRLLQEPAHYGLATRALLDRLARQGVARAEVNLSVGVMLWKGQDATATFMAIRKAAEGHPVQVGWVVDAVRQFGEKKAWPVVEWAVAQKCNGVVGFGIGGDEVRGPVREFRDVFDYAKRGGLSLLPHAGETDGPESVWGALECGADRIGHGIRSVEDPLLVRHLADRQISLEVCITSNVCTGAVACLEQHPVRTLHDAGVPIVLNTDDPALFRTSLQREYEIVHRVFGLSPLELARQSMHSVSRVSGQ